jgi:hypothetical protein
VTFPDAAVLEKPRLDRTKGEITLMWSRSTAKDFLKYEVFESDGINFTPSRSSLVKAIYSAGTNSATLPFRGETGRFKVRVYNTYWLWSDSKELTADPTRVELMKIFVAGEKSLTVQWSSNPDTDFRSYTLFMSENLSFTPSDSSKVIELRDRNVTNHTVQKLKPDHRYFFVVKVSNAVGLEALSNQVEARTLKQDRSRELYDLAWTGITMASLAFFVILVSIVVIAIQAARLGRLRRETAALKEEREGRAQPPQYPPAAPAMAQPVQPQYAPQAQPAHPTQRHPRQALPADDIPYVEARAPPKQY